MYTWSGAARLAAYNTLRGLLWALQLSLSSPLHAGDNCTALQVLLAPCQYRAAVYRIHAKLQDGQTDILTCTGLLMMFKTAEMSCVRAPVFAVRRGEGLGTSICDMEAGVLAHVYRGPDTISLQCKRGFRISACGIREGTRPCVNRA